MIILIPMAGAGSRFINEGYKDSKPLIDVAGLPMIVRVIDNLPTTNKYIFIIRKDIHDNERLYNLLLGLNPNSKIITIDKLTQGTAETCLLAKDIINNDESLLIANCDQIQDWNENHFNKFINEQHSSTDGVIITFKSNSPGHSYIQLNENNFITKVAEKQVISNDATTGVYFWRKGSSFVKCAEEMINKNIRTNNEFYVCPAYQHLIESGGKVISYPITKHWSIGTPEELKRYISSYEDR